MKRCILFFLAFLMIPASGGCENKQHILLATQAPYESLTSLSFPQYAEVEEILLPFIGENAEDIAETYDGKIPYRGSGIIRINGGQIELGRINNYFGAIFIQWENSNFPIKCFRGIEVGMQMNTLETILIGIDEHFKSKKDSLIISSDTAIQYSKISDYDILITSIVRKECNGKQKCIKTEFLLSSDVLSAIRLYYTETSL